MFVKGVRFLAIFEMIKYHDKQYPKSIPLRIAECSANFDVSEFDSDLDISMLPNIVMLCVK